MIQFVNKLIVIYKFLLNMITKINSLNPHLHSAYPQVTFHVPSQTKVFAANMTDITFFPAMSHSSMVIKVCSVSENPVTLFALVWRRGGISSVASHV